LPSAPAPSPDWANCQVSHHMAPFCRSLHSVRSPHRGTRGQSIHRGPFMEHPSRSMSATPLPPCPDAAAASDARRAGVRMRPFPTLFAAEARPYGAPGLRSRETPLHMRPQTTFSACPSR
jgi:hypothetical protein